MSARLTLVAGGGHVYVFPAGDWRIAHQRMVLDVAFPADDVGQRTIDAADYTPALRDGLRAAGFTVVDCRPELTLPAIGSDGMADDTDPAELCWNFMQVEVVANDHVIRPLIGPGGLSRHVAHAEIQAILDKDGGLAEIAEGWRRGAKDDTAYAAPFTWTIYSHPRDEDPRIAAVAWLKDFAAIMRSTGLDVQVAALPSEGK